MPSLTQTLLTTLLALHASLTSAITPSPGCTTTTPTNFTTGITNHTITINSKPRWYLLNIPPTYSPTTSPPPRLIFTLHAFGGNSTMLAFGEGGYLPWYGLPPYTTTTTTPPSAIYIAPNGLDRGWANSAGEDVLFITTIARTIKSTLCIDEDLVFSIGFSYGASMSYALACAQPSPTDPVGSGLRLRAVAVQSGGNMSGCAPTLAGTKLREPVALYGQHGVDGDLNLTMARQIRDQFVERNGCRRVEGGEMAVLGTGAHSKTVYEGCREGYPVTWIEYDGGHTPRPTDRGANATWAAEETWAFFGQFK